MRKVSFIIIVVLLFSINVMAQSAGGSGNENDITVLSTDYTFDGFIAVNNLNKPEKRVTKERKIEKKENQDQKLSDAFWDSEIIPLIPGEAKFVTEDDTIKKGTLQK